MTESTSTAAAEWRRYYPLPLAAALGYATSVIHIYGLGPYFEPISETFGWTRAQVNVGTTIATLIQAVFGLLVGYIVDRRGPRILAIIGVFTTCAAFALIGTADGSRANWYLLWVVMAVATLPVQATVWTSAVTTRFEASRGLAFAVTLCGASVAATIFPWLGAKLIAAYGWQYAMAAQAGIWVLVAAPVILLFFRGARDGGAVEPAAVTAAAPAVELDGVGIKAGVFSTIYLRLFVASLMFTFTIVALAQHFFPMLTLRKFDAEAAAGIAGIIGLASIVGRLGTGLLLDRFAASRIGALAFVLPVLGALLLLGGGRDAPTAMAAAALVGLTLGAEIDVIVYLVTRHFGLKNFGTLYGGLLAALSIGTAAGPYYAATVFDATGGYDPFLKLTLGMMAVSSLLLLSLPKPRFGGQHS
jgi:MFS family permease